MQFIDAATAKRGGATWDMSVDTTLVRMVAGNAKAAPGAAAFREKKLGLWNGITWSEMLDSLVEGAAGLEALGFEREEALLVLGDNRAQLYIGMLAAGALNGYAMPVFPDATLEEIRHFAQEVRVRFAFAEDQEQVDKVLELREQGLSIEHIIYDEPRGLLGYAVPGLMSWRALRANGAERLHAHPRLREALIHRAQPASPAVFVHSSGTTGKPKGVMLSHRNVLAGVRSSYLGGACGFGEDILAYLPMAWLGDFLATMACGIALRFTIHIPESQETVLNDLREVAPTFYFASPRSWDTMLSTIQVRMADSTPFKKWVYRVFMDNAVAAERRKLEGQPLTLKHRLLRPLAELLVCGPIKDQFGLTRLRHAFTGGEAIGEDTFVFYRALGVQLRQLYAQTEGGAFTALQDPQEVRLHTVGRPLPGVEVRISDIGEILIRSESVFGGYHMRDDATREVLRDGWLHTGDAGLLEPNGQLVVLGRLSEVVHTAQGERYIPNYIENRLKFSPYVKELAVLGKGRDQLAAIICIDKDPVGHWAEMRGISYTSLAELSQRPEVLDLVAQAVRNVNKTLPDGLKLRRFVCLHKEFDADDGEITRTRKLRRNVVEERYAPIIDAIYAGESEVVMKAQVTYETGQIGITERRLSVRDV